MARKKDNNLTEIIHLRISEKTKKWYAVYSKTLNIPEADLHRLALEMFRQCGGIEYAKEDN